MVGCGAAARVWAERCRGHVGAGGSVTLMEVPSGDGEDGAGQVRPEVQEGLQRGGLACKQGLCLP